MSESNVTETSVVLNDTFVDFKSVIEKLQKKGVNKDLESIAIETGYTVPGLKKLMKKSPKAITFLYHFLKQNKLKLEDLVKEV